MENGTQSLRTQLRLDWVVLASPLDSEISGPATAEARLTQISHHNLYPALKEFLDPLRAENPRAEHMYYCQEIACHLAAHEGIR